MREQTQGLGSERKEGKNNIRINPFTRKKKKSNCFLEMKLLHKKIHEIPVSRCNQEDQFESNTNIEE